MRLLHTSDWHLGQTLADYDRSAEHQQFLDWLLETLVRERVDALVVAGDIFDTANPSAAAQRQFYQFLATARKQLPQLAIALIAGNHDSPGRLEAPQPFLDILNASVVGHVHRLTDGRVDAERLVVPLHAGDGGVAAWCLAVPFLRPGDVPRVDVPGDEDPFALGVALLYRQALDVALARRGPGQPIIAMGHCHMVGGQVSEESERRILIGGAEALSADVFSPEIAYVALGHLHRAQQVGGREHVRYCGSPLPMSFSEIAYQHQVVLVDFEGERCGEVRPVPIPRPVPFLRIPEKPASPDEVIAALEALEVAPGAPAPYLEVQVRLEAPEPGLRAQVDAALTGKDVRLVKISPSYARRETGEAQEVPLSLEDLQALQPETVLERLYQKAYGEEIPTTLRRLFGELLAEPVEEPVPESVPESVPQSVEGGS